MGKKNLLALAISMSMLDGERGNYHIIATPCTNYCS